MKYNYLIAFLLGIFIGLLLFNAIASVKRADVDTQERVPIIQSVERGSVYAYSFQGL